MGSSLSICKNDETKKSYDLFTKCGCGSESPEGKTFVIPSNQTLEASEVAARLQDLLCGGPAPGVSCSPPVPAAPRERRQSVGASTSLQSESQVELRSPNGGLDL